MSFEIEAMGDNEVQIELAVLEKFFDPPDFNRLENLLFLRAAVLGWTGDPLQQPPRSVLACARQVMTEKEAKEQQP